METRRSSRIALDAFLGHWTRLGRRRLALAAVLVPALLLVATAVAFAFSQESLPRSPMAPQADPVGTTFTYQGQLKKNGSTVNGPCDFQFGIYDAETQGNQYGITQTMSISVTDGLFTANLDFGDVFTGIYFGRNMLFHLFSIRLICLNFFLFGSLYFCFHEIGGLDPGFDSNTIC